MDDLFHRHEHHDHEDDEHLDHRILRHLRTIEEQLAALQATVDRLIPGPPSFGAIIFQGGFVSAISVPDSSGPLTATASYADAAGHATSPESPPSWSSSDSTVATVDSSGDPSGVTAQVTIVGVGEADISATTTNDDGSVVTALGTVTVTAGAPVSGDVSFA